MLELQKFMQEHDNWAELLAAEPYNLKISYYEKLVMFKYNQLTADFSIPLVREARGIILERKSPYRVVCWPFEKFFNYGEEHDAQIDWSTASVQEKIDGSLMKCYFWDGEWRLATNGTINAYLAQLDGCIEFQTYGELWDNIWPNWREVMNMYGCPNLTYMFEMVSPYNKVVIPYQNSEIYFLGWRNCKTGEELPPESSIISQYRPMPNRYPLNSLGEVIAAANNLPWDREGYVVCDGEFNRVKIKSPAYVAAHYTVANGIITKKKLLKVILANEEEEFLVYCSEYKEAIDEIKEDMRELQQWCEEALHKISELPGYWRNYPRKEIFERVQDWPYIEFKYIMDNYNGYVSWKDFTKNWSENKWMEVLYG